MAKQIEREVGSILLSDKLILEVTRPDAATQGNVVAAVVSCTGVEVSNDLQVVKVYVSVYTDDNEAKQHMISRLNGLAGCGSASSVYPYHTERGSVVAAGFTFGE